MAKVRLTEAHRNFFCVEIRNEREGGISPATLDSAFESLKQAPKDVIVDWCDDDKSVTEKNVSEFVDGVVALRDRLGGHVELQDLLD